MCTVGWLSLQSTIVFGEHIKFIRCWLQLQPWCKDDGSGLGIHSENIVVSQHLISNRTFVSISCLNISHSCLWWDIPDDREQILGLLKDWNVVILIIYNNADFGKCRFHRGIQDPGFDGYNICILRFPIQRHLGDNPRRTDTICYLRCHFKLRGIATFQTVKYDLVIIAYFCKHVTKILDQYSSWLVLNNVTFIGWLREWKQRSTIHNIYVDWVLPDFGC